MYVYICVCMYVCMSVCMYVCMYNARYVQFNVNSFTTTAWTNEADKLFEAAIDWVMETPTSVDDHALPSLPSDYSLSQNYPNPFNPTTTITYSIPDNGNVTLNIYDVLGNKIIQLENNNKTAGSYSTFFDASDLTSGIYFYTIRANNFVETRKMLLMK